MLRPVLRSSALAFREHLYSGQPNYVIKHVTNAFKRGHGWSLGKVSGPHPTGPRRAFGSAPEPVEKPGDKPGAKAEESADKKGHGEGHATTDAPSPSPSHGGVPGSHEVQHQLKDRAAEKVTFKILERIANKAKTVGERAGESVAARAVERGVERSVERATERVAERAAERAVERVAERAGERVAERAGERAVERIAEQAGERAAERIAERAGERAAERVAERAGERIAERTGERVAERAGERAAERAAEQAALGSSGAAARAGFSTSLYGGQAVTASMERSAKGFFDVLASGFTWVARAAEELVGRLGIRGGSIVRAARQVEAEALRMSTAAKSLGQRVAERVVPRVGRGLAVGLPILGTVFVIKLVQGDRDRLRATRAMGARAAAAVFMIALILDGTDVILHVITVMGLLSDNYGFGIDPGHDLRHMAEYGGITCAVMSTVAAILGELLASRAQVVKDAAAAAAKIVK